MPFRRSVAVLAGLAIVLTVAVSCRSVSSDYTDPETLSALITSGTTDYILVDVRTPEEFKSGAIPTAINIPHTEIGASPPTNDKSALIIVYCKSGGRAFAAQQALEKAGYRNVVNFGAVGRYTGELVVTQ